MSYIQRNIKVEFTLEQGKTFQGGGDTLTISNMRCYVTIGAYGGVSGTEVTLHLWGLSDSQMTTLSRKSMWVDGAPMNQMRVWAGEKLIFEGIIRDAYADFNQMPDVPLIIAADMMFKLRGQAVAPFSAAGDVPIDNIIMPMAKSIGLAYENAGVTGVRPNPYFDGNIVQQMLQAAESVNAYIDIDTDKVTIWPKNGTRRGSTLFISPENGLIGYPVFTGRGLSITTMFEPELVIGRKVELKTSLPNASAVYIATSAEHHLTSWIEGGQWHTSCILKPMGKEKNSG
ncbi:baseplate hub protein [Xenorhabdus hominickii]|uniref:Phage protein n=1 Tax=Xenorhabdus hominickii TaxID=351679 RepID=A0A2G0Q2J9_XENHO|nr:hypothetical protein [Xenorhabdus hominickii]AOM39685.1 hypothetical protein A9255_03220 [Xenorhabdus hominickii]PHM53442.1 hypothetical protein Xhom_03440 [Xenorhabdus hominickii]